MARLRQLARRAGGFVADAAVQSGRDQVRQATLELKVPSARFDELTEGLEPIGRLEFVNVERGGRKRGVRGPGRTRRQWAPAGGAAGRAAPDPDREAAGRPVGRARAGAGAGGDRADRGAAALSQDQRRSSARSRSACTSRCRSSRPRGAVRSPRRSGRHGATSWGCSRRRSRPSAIWCRSSCSAGAWSRSGEGGGDRRRRRREERTGKREAGSPASLFTFPFPAVLLGVLTTFAHARRYPGHRRPPRRRRAHLRRHPAQGGGRRLPHRRSSTSPPARPAPAAAPSCGPRRPSARPQILGVSGAAERRAARRAPAQHRGDAPHRGRARSATSRPGSSSSPSPSAATPTIASPPSWAATPASWPAWPSTTPPAPRTGRTRSCTPSPIGRTR